MAYAPVNGLQLYYETHGSGRPLILLHGGLMTIDLNWGSLLEPLAANRQVIAVELQGHGHTADTDPPARGERFYVAAPPHGAPRKLVVSP
jgi:pimeloyl-ACP methyl ester carboxylesterase